VHIVGRGAWIIAKLLENAKASASIERIPAGAGRQEAIEAYEAIRAAAIWWAAERENGPGFQADPATGSDPTQGHPAPDAVAGALSAAQAAALIGCSERRVRQLLAAERLVGRLVSGRWLVEAASVDDYLLARDAA
jgi:hypothetical protein